jgi:choline dehydrogenase-like flavoprotein
LTYDAIVVGAGPGGGAAAALLAEAGNHVLLIEQGARWRVADDPRDHIASLTGPVQGLDGGPARTRRVTAGGTSWSLIGGVGGGTLTWGMQAWRFHPDDFRMATRYGVPDGSSLADWPISYDDLEPFCCGPGGHAREQLCQGEKIL